jgi:hypothetical protein
MDYPVNAEQEPAANDRPRLREQVEALLALTRSMLIAADEQKWDIVAETESRRRDVISGLSGALPTSQDAAHIAECLRQILTLDRCLIEQGEAGLRELASTLAGFDRGRRANEAYGDAAIEISGSARP